jgi:hypothetical protein
MVSWCEQESVAATQGLRHGRPGLSNFLHGTVMAKSSPEKLAKALRANLKRRKDKPAAAPPAPPPKPVAPPRKVPR